MMVGVGLGEDEGGGVVDEAGLVDLGVRDWLVVLDAGVGVGRGWERRRA